VVLALLTLPGCKKLGEQVARFRGASTASVSKPVQRPKSDVVVATIYDGGLKPEWQDWGWGAHDLAHGPASIDLSNYGGWILWNPGFPGELEGLVFRLQAPSSYGSFLEVRLAFQKNDSAFPAVDVGPGRLRSLSDGWVEVYLAWSELNPANLPVDQLTLRARTSVGSDRVRFDKMVLTAPDPSAKPAASKTDQVRLSVDCRAPDRPISPYIYGVAGGGEPWEFGATARRWGGNRTTRYNWERLVTNAGKDWFFENTKEGDYRKVLKENREHGAFTALTLPLIGWVAKDDSSSGFPVSKLGPQHSTDQWRPEAGDGTDKNGKSIAPGPPTETSVPADPAFVRRWVQALVADDARQGSRSVEMYILDNEPSLWNVTHRDVHPNALTYDELLDRTLRYGREVRAVDPQALIAGPAEWGWSAYFYSAKDLESGAMLRPDRRAHGDVPLVPWYLQRLREHEKTTGERLLDVLDVHYYPQGTNVYGNAADVKTAALRIRSTRSLWDPTYKDESWINDTVRLIPRLKEWVAQNYPGLRISLGEYNFGGEQHASGGLALAEALGRFGTEGLDYAFYWFEPPKNSPTYWAFRAFRNFDGKGARFLDRAVATKMAPSVSLFASRDGSRKHLVLIALNLDPDAAARARIELLGCGQLGTTRKFVYTPRSQALIPDGTQDGGELDGELPPYSITVFDVLLK
jgi:hypothetical protein